MRVSCLLCLLRHAAMSQPQTALCSVRPPAGRPHQIRIHMAAAGHPLVGDPLYAPGGLPWPVKPAASEEAGSAAAGTGCAAAAVQHAEAAGREAAGQRGSAAATAVAGNGSPPEQAQQQAEGSSQGSNQCGLRQPPRAVMPGECGYLLHSMVLEFTHPISGERVVATCQPPPPLRRPGE